MANLNTAPQPGAAPNPNIAANPNILTNPNASPAAAVAARPNINPALAPAVGGGINNPGQARNALLEIVKMPIPAKGELMMKVVPSQLKELRDSGNPQNMILAIDLEAANIQRQVANLENQGVPSFSQDIRNAQARLVELQAERVKIDPSGKQENMVVKLAGDIAKGSGEKFDPKKDNPIDVLEAAFKKGMKDPNKFLDTLLNSVPSLSAQEKKDVSDALLATGESMDKQRKDGVKGLLAQGGIMALIAILWAQLSQFLKLDRTETAA